MQKKAVLYIHGQGGSAEEAAHYRPLFPSCDVVGLAYKCVMPWEAGAEIKEAVGALKNRYDEVLLIANSIGAFFSMHADIGEDVSHAYFISPVVDMEKLITDRMRQAEVTEAELREKGTVTVGFGEALSWDYLCFVRRRPIRWNVPTDILYGGRDALTSMETITAFARTHCASLTVMEGGEHWFHTQEQMAFMDDWIRKKEQDVS